MFIYLTSAEATPTLTSKREWDGGATETWDDIGNFSGNYSGSRSGGNGHTFKSTKEYQVQDGVTTWSSSASESGRVTEGYWLGGGQSCEPWTLAIVNWVTSSGVSTYTSSETFTVMQGTVPTTKTETYSELQITTSQSSSSSVRNGQNCYGTGGTKSTTRATQTSASGSSSYSAQGAYIVGWQTTATSTVWAYKTTLTEFPKSQVETAGTTKVLTYSTGDYSGTNSTTKKVISTTTVDGDVYTNAFISYQTDTVAYTITIITDKHTTSRKSVLDYHTVYAWEPKETTTLYIFTATEIGKTTTKFEDLCTSYTTDMTLTARLGIISGERETYDENGAKTYRSQTKGGRVATPITQLEESTVTSTTFTGGVNSTIKYSYPAETTGVSGVRGTETVVATYMGGSWEKAEYKTTSDGNGGQYMSVTYSYLDYTTTTADPAGFPQPVIGSATSFRDYAFKLGTRERKNSSGQVEGSTQCSGNYTYNLGNGKVSPWFGYYIKRLSGEAAAGAGSKTGSYGLYSSADVSGSNNPLGKPNSANTTDIAFPVAGITAKRPYCNPHIILETKGSSKNTSRTSNMIYVDGGNVTFITTSENSSTGSSGSSSASVKTVGKAITYYAGKVVPFYVDFGVSIYPSGEASIGDTRMNHAWTVIDHLFGAQQDKTFVWAASVDFMSFKDTLVLGGLFDTHTSGTAVETTSYDYKTLSKGDDLSYFRKIDMYFVC